MWCSSWFYNGSRLTGLLAVAFATAVQAAPLTGLRPPAEAHDPVTGVRVETIDRPQGRMNTLPPSVRNLRHLPVVRNQQLNNCGAFSPTYYYKTYQEAREHGWDRPDPLVNPERVMSPGFTFPLANQGENNGASVGQVMELMCRYGVASWAVMPETLGYTDYPNEAAWRDAMRYRGDHLLQIDLKTAAGIVALKQHLAGGDPAVVAVLLYHDTFDQYGQPGWGVGVNNDVIYNTGNQLWDWHAFTIVGYDDAKSYSVDGQPRQGAFLAVNSWGPDWGVYESGAGSKGFVWFGYDFIMSRAALAGPAYAMVDRIGYTPTDVALLDMSIFQRRYLKMKLHVGAPGRPLSAALEAFPNAGGTLPFGGRLALDITDFKSLEPLCYTLDYEDLSDSFGAQEGDRVGGVTRLVIEKNGIETVAAPVTTILPADIRAGVPATVVAGPLWESGCGLDGLTTKGLCAAWGDWTRDGAPDLALAGGGYLANSQTTLLYRNLNTRGLALHASPTNLPGLLYSGLDWGDYDNDGLADLAVAGMLDWDGNKTAVYRNRQLGQFEESGPAMPGLSQARTAWGDYDNDGRLDLLICGATDLGAALTRLYRNLGNGQLADSGVVLPQVKAQAASWADVDNDGWLDLALGGQVLRNNGDHTFTVQATLGEGRYSSHAWGDYDGDGRLDLAWCRLDNDGQTPEERVATRLFHNEGNFVLREVPAGLTGVQEGALAWCDLDGDGRLDLGLCGFSDLDWEHRASRIYRQTTDGRFVDLGVDLPDVAAGSLTWCDLDGNGAPDLLISGFGAPNPVNGMAQGSTAFFANQRTNAAAAPAIPAGLEVRHDAAGITRLLWNGAEGALDPAARPTGYRVRVGTSPMGSEIVSPEGTLAIAEPHGTRLEPEGRPGRLLSNLPAGRYYWSVQAIGGGLALSAWSAEQVFVLGAAGLVDGDANRDGVLNVADVVSAVQMGQGAMAARPEAADLNSDGRVNVLDARLIAQRIAGGGPADPYLQVATKIIGPEGGTLAAPEFGFELVVPAGAMPWAVPLMLDIAPGPSAQLGADALPLAWRVRGLTGNEALPLRVRVQDLRPDQSSPPYLAMGRECFARSLNQVVTSHQYLPATVAAGGWLDCELPLMEGYGPQKAALNATAGATAALQQTGPDGYDYTLVMYLLAASQWRYDGGHFRVIGPFETKDQLPALAQDLEDAYAYYTATLGFDLGRRNWAKYPLAVTVKNLGKGTTGEPVAGYTVAGLGYNDVGIEINQLILGDASARRLTVGHEFFHVVQALYDTRGRLARKMTAPNLWLDEATASLMESYFAPNSDLHKPDLLKAYKTMAFGGFWQADAFWSETRQNYGYAMATLAAHFVQRNGGDRKCIRGVYEWIGASTDALTALVKSDPGYPAVEWASDYYRNMVKDVLYPDLLPLPLLLADIATPQRTVKLTTARERGKRFAPQSIYPLGAGLTCLKFDAPLLEATAEDSIGFQLKTENPDDYDLIVLAASIGGGVQFFDFGRPTVDEDHGTLRVNQTDATRFVRKNTWLLPIAVNKRDTLPMTEASESVLSYGVYRDYPNRPIAPHSYRLASASYWGEDLGWPVFENSGVFSAFDVTMLQEQYKTPSSPNAIPGINFYLWGTPARAVDFSLTAQPTSTTFETINRDEKKIECQINGPVQYRLRTYRARVLGPFNTQTEWVSDGAWQASAHFTLEIPTGAEAMLYAIDIQYPYHIKVTSKANTVLLDTDQQRQTTLFTTYLFGY